MAYHSRVCLREKRDTIDAGRGGGGGGREGGGGGGEKGKFAKLCAKGADAKEVKVYKVGDETHTGKEQTGEDGL